MALTFNKIRRIFEGLIEISIILNNLKKFIFENKVIFMIFIISQIVSSISIIYIYAVFDAKRNQDIVYDNSLKSYTIEFLSKADESIPRVLDTIYEQHKKDFKQAILYSDSSSIKLNYVYPPNEARFTQIGSYFSKEAFESGKMQVIVNNLQDKDYKIGDIFTINNAEYTIVGLASNNDYNEIPFKAFTTYSEINRIVFVTDEIPNKTQSEAMTQYLYSEFNNVQVKPPVEANYFLSSENLVSYLVSILIFLLAIVNISYIYKYILQSRKKYFVVIRICGCSERYAMILYLSEVIILSTAQFALSCFITHFGVSKFFAYLNFDLVYSMNIYKYIGLYTFYIAIVVIVFVRVISKFIRRPLFSLL